MDLLNRDLQTFAEIGNALWPDPRRARPIAIETLSAVSLLDLTEERAIERASAAMLDIANRQGMAATTIAQLESGNGSALFFRLPPIERFVLSALHQGRWSYERVGRVIGESVEAVESIAWRARIRLGAEIGRNAIGARLAGANCPEYDLERPWTQRFLDEEIKTGREKMFFQNHLMACDNCREVLTRCRDLYYAIERLLPKASSRESSDSVAQFEKVFRKGRRIRIPGSEAAEAGGFSRGMLRVLRKPDVLLLLALIMALLIYRRFS